MIPTTCFTSIRTSSRSRRAAADYYQQAIELIEPTGDYQLLAISLIHLGEALQENDDAQGAVDAWLHALTILEPMRSPAATEMRQRISALQRRR